MTGPRLRLRRAGTVWAGTVWAGKVRAAALVAGAALTVGAVLALAPGAIGQAAAMPRTSAAPGAARAAAPPKQAVIILLDVNGEDGMAASRIAAERQAALRYLAALPAGIPAGLITFSDSWRLVAPPAGHERLAAALAAVRLAGQSSAGLGGGLSAATAALARAGALAGGRLLVLSDGEDLGGHLAAPPVPADVVAWQPDRDDNAAALRALALASGGHTASPGRAAMLAPALAPVPAARAASGPPGSPRIGAGTPGAGSLRHRPLALLAMLGGVFAALVAVGLLAAGLVQRGRRGRLLEERIARHARPQRPAPAEEAGTLTRTAVGWVARLLSGPAEQRLAERLDLAGIGRSPGEWLLFGCAAGLALAAVLTLVTGNFLIGLPGGALLGWLGMRLVLNVRIARRRSAFTEQLPDLLQIVSSSLQSGFSLPQALDAAAREGARPASSEFARALSQTRIGVDLAAALLRVADRMSSTDLQWAVMTIGIQREVGGNLAEVLNTTVGTIRERAQLRRHVKALSAEGRLSAYILIALPVLIGGWLFLTSPVYMRPLYTTSLGIGMLAAAAVLTGLGAFWMSKVIKVEM